MANARQPRRGQDERREQVLTVAGRLFRERGIHEVGMDELIGATGLAKMSVYRVFPTKADVIAAYLAGLASAILGLIDEGTARAADPRDALDGILDAVAADVGRTGFRGCPFGNAAAEFAAPDHPARLAASDYRRELRGRLTDLVVQAGGDTSTADELAILIDGMYLNAAHLGADGPAVAGLALARRLVRQLPVGEHTVHRHVD